MKIAEPKRCLPGSQSVHSLTLIELIVATTILLILSGMAVPLARVTIKRDKE